MMFMKSVKSDDFFCVTLYMIILLSFSVFTSEFNSLQADIATMFMVLHSMIDATL